jgi:hypothetical protein
VEQWEKRWNNWLSTLAVCHRQVLRAIDASADQQDGECGLGVVAVATMLEAYVNQFAMSELLPDQVDYYKNLDTPDRYRFLPRCSGTDTKTAKEFETQTIHRAIERVFVLRNQFVHGKLEEWDPRAVPPSELSRLWNESLDMLLALELVGDFRIPASRYEQYEAEIDALRMKPST